MDADGRGPLPPSGTVRFAQAGTHAVSCLIHPSMQGTVVVS